MEDQTVGGGEREREGFVFEEGEVRRRYLWLCTNYDKGIQLTLHY